MIVEVWCAEWGEGGKKDRKKQPCSQPDLIKVVLPCWQYLKVGESLRRMQLCVSLTSHTTSQKEEGSDHTATIEWLSQHHVDMTNIRFALFIDYTRHGVNNYVTIIMFSRCQRALGQTLCSSVSSQLQHDQTLPSSRGGLQNYLGVVPFPYCPEKWKGGSGKQIGMEMFTAECQTFKQSYSCPQTLKQIILRVWEQSNEIDELNSTCKPGSVQFTPPPLPDHFYCTVSRVPVLKAFVFAFTTV